jgi:voltage-gated potassium channel
MSVKQIVEETDTRAGRLFDLVVVGLILISIADFSIETLPDLTPGTLSLLRWVETVSVLLFTIEYLLRVLVADRKARFIFSFFGLIDLAAILPFNIALGVDLRSVRAIRLVRLLRAVKLARYSDAMNRFRRAAVIAREELIVFLGVAGMLMYLSAVGIYYFENEAQPEVFASVFHGLWWAVVTLTTVGYGDTFPIALEGRLFTAAVLMAGLGSVAVPTGLIASAMAKVREEDRTQPR